MSQHWRNPDSDDEENEEDEDLNFGGRDGIIFLVDCAKSMFTSNGGEDEEESQSKFSITFECIEAVMRNRIIMSDKDLVILQCYLIYYTHSNQHPLFRSALSSTTRNTVKRTVCLPICISFCPKSVPCSFPWTFRRWRISRR